MGFIKFWIFSTLFFLTFPFISLVLVAIQSQEGFGFAKGVCVTSVESPDEIDFRKSNVVLKVDTHEDVKKAYEEATSVIERV